MKLKYKCLILDHDDTAVKSTPHIHYPSFVEAQKRLRPDEEPLLLEEFINYCFDPGFSALCEDIIQFTEEEYQVQQEIWSSYTEATIPEFYEWFPETIQEFKKQGGLITVVSHSKSSRIERDYQTHCGLVPDAIFGYDAPAHQRKPAPYPVLEILKRFSLEKKDVLMLDDLKPGLEMARRANIDFASAGWSHQIPEIKKQMEKESDYYFDTVQEFRNFVFNE